MSKPCKRNQSPENLPHRLSQSCRRVRLPTFNHARTWVPLICILVVPPNSWTSIIIFPNAWQGMRTKRFVRLGFVFHNRRLSV